MDTGHRSRSARIVAFPLLLAGIWGGLIPFVGPSLNFGMGKGGSWVWSESHATLHLAPAVAAVIGAFVILGARGRGSQAVGAALAALGGIWFVIAPSLHPLWTTGGSSGHMMMGTSKLRTALEALAYHYGIGAVIATLAAFALGLVASSRGSRDIGQPAKTQPSPATDERSALVGA